MVISEKEIQRGKKNSFIILWIRKRDYKPNPAITPMGMAQGHISDFSSKTKKKVIAEPSIDKISERDGARCIYEVDNTMKVVAYFFQDNDFNDYRLTMSAPIDDFEKYLPIFERIKNSIRIN